jgi:hypothetical protein
MPIILNKEYTFLTPVIELPERTKSRGKIYHCICRCGNELDVPGASLVTNNTKSCGCLHTISAKKAGSKIRKRNVYNLEDKKIGVGYTTNTGLEFYFDIEDYDLIKDYNWIEKIDNRKRTGYVKTTFWDNNKPQVVYFHRFVLDENGFNIQNKDVDHINYKTYDNRKKNLRVCEHHENIIACKTYSNNTSGRKGVYWDKSRNKWMVAITVNKMTIHIGRFDDYDKAVKAREEAEVKYHGEFHFSDN